MKIYRSALYSVTLNIWICSVRGVPPLHILQTTGRRQGGGRALCGVLTHDVHSGDVYICVRVYKYVYISISFDVLLGLLKKNHVANCNEEFLMDA